MPVERIHSVACEEDVDQAACIVDLGLQCEFFKWNRIARHIEVVGASVVAVKCLVINDPCTVDSGPFFKISLKIVLENLELECLGQFRYCCRCCSDCCLALLETAYNCGCAPGFDADYRAVPDCPLDILRDIDRQQRDFHVQLVACIHEVVFFILRCNYQRNVTGFLIPDRVHRTLW